MIKKPIGEAGLHELRVRTGQEPELTWIPIEFPDTKPEQEMFFAEQFAKLVGGVVTRLPENDLDFALTANGRESYLELMEVTFPGKKRGSPYADRQQRLVNGKFADTIIRGLAQKRYGPGPKPIDLLLYVTHWRFNPSVGVKKLLTHYLMHNLHAFSEVHLLVPLGTDECSCDKLFPPEPDALRGFDPALYRNLEFYNFDPRKAGVTETDEGVALDFGAMDLKSDP